MAQDITGVTLTAPASDPAPDVSTTFTMSATYTQAGHGGEETVSLHWEYSTTSGGPYSAIPSSGSELTTPTNPTTGSDSAVTHSATITAQGAGTYYVHVRAVGDISAASFENGNQVVTVADTTDELTANSVSATSSVGSPTIGQVHALTGNSATSAASTGAPDIGQAHGLAATGISAAPSVGSPTLAEAVGDELTADSVSASASVGTPQIGQVHTLTATGISAAPSVGNPDVVEIHNLVAIGPGVSSSTGAPAIGQTHGLGASGFTAISTTGHPALGGPGGRKKKHSKKIKIFGDLGV